MSDQQSEEEVLTLEKLMQNPIVAAASWGLGIQAEIARSNFLPLMLKEARDQEEMAINMMIEATSDEGRREWQLAARTFRQFREIIDHIQQQAAVAVDRLVAEEIVETPD